MFINNKRWEFRRYGSGTGWETLVLREIPPTAVFKGEMILFSKPGHHPGRVYFLREFLSAIFYTLCWFLLEGNFYLKGSYRLFYFMTEDGSTKYSIIYSIVWDLRLWLSVSDRERSYPLFFSVPYSSRESRPTLNLEVLSKCNSRNAPAGVEKGKKLGATVRDRRGYWTIIIPPSITRHYNSGTRLALFYGLEDALPRAKHQKTFTVNVNGRFL